MTVELISQPNAVLNLIGTAQAPVIIDVCLPEDVADAPLRLPGAHRIAHGQTAEKLRNSDPARAHVVVCQKGLKLSQGAAAALRAQGHAATALDGGIMAWAEVGHPTMSDTAPAARYALPDHQSPEALLHAWLILRWIAPQATLLWVPIDMCGPVAARFDAQTAPGPSETANAAQITWPPLTAFLHDAMNAPNGWFPLLAALPVLHNSAQTLCAHALPIIDAAWTAQRSDKDMV